MVQFRSVVANALEALEREDDAAEMREWCRKAGHHTMTSYRGIGENAA